jgi:hypothetical protein
MKVTVKFQGSARRGLDEWLESLRLDRPENRAMRNVYLEELQDLLRSGPERL